jgi:hypothetical protein
MKNGKPNALEARLERLEADVKDIKAMLEAQQPAKPATWKDFVGIFANDPVAEEVDRIVRENREKERRRARRKPYKAKS